MQYWGGYDGAVDVICLRGFVGDQRFLRGGVDGRL